MSWRRKPARSGISSRAAECLRARATISLSGTALIKRCGEDAPIQAAMRADALLDEGDLDGQAAWRQILAAIEELLRKEPGEGEGVH